MGRSRDDLGEALRSIAVKPYTIFYRVGDTVEIARVLYGARDVSTAYFR